MIYDDALAPARRALDRANHLLDRIAGSGREAELLTAQLAPGMFDCAAQLQTVPIFALRATFPLAGQAWPRGTFDADLPGLRDRIAWAQVQLDGLAPADFEGAETRLITHRAGDADLTQSGADYLTLFALPNLWFHLSMAFAILRAEGLDIGKADFDGWHFYEKGFQFVD